MHKSTDKTELYVISGRLDVCNETFRDLGEIITAIIDERHVDHAFISFSKICLLVHNKEATDREHNKLGAKTAAATHFEKS